jgi:hypothetical protein
VPTLRRLATLVAVALAVAGCGGGGGTAALIDPGESPVTADVGDLRVLRHRDDPTAGDEWIDVLEAHPDVFERTGAFREEGSRTAEPDDPGDVRLLYEARSPGSTLVVRMDCRGCGDDGVPSTPVEGTELLAWELVAGSRSGPERYGDGAAVAGEVAEVRVGDHLVVVREGADTSELELDARPGQQPVLRLVASTDEPRQIDVFAGVGVGAVGIVDPASGDRYPVAVAV